MVDALDSKSSSTGVRVRFPPWVQNRMGSRMRMMLPILFFIILILILTLNNSIFFTIFLFYRMKMTLIMFFIIFTLKARVGISLENPENVIGA